MTESRAASRYVKSLLNLAVEQGALEHVHEDMQSFSKIIDQNREFSLMVHNPIIRHDKKRAIFHKLFGGRFHKLTLGMMDLISKKYREPILPAIAREFHLAYNEYKGITRAFVTTPTPIDQKLRSEFNDIVGKIAGKTQVELIEKVDPSIIGGFVLKVGDRQIDTSIKSKLNALELQISKNPYVREI